MQSILLIIHSIILFILLNLFLYTNNIILLFVLIILFVYIIYRLFKIDKKYIKKILFLYSIFVLFFVFYLYSFLNLKIDGNNYDFLNIESNFITNNSDLNINLYDIEDYRNCFEQGCNLSGYYENDIKNINDYIKNSSDILSLVKLIKYIDLFIENKSFLESKGIDTSKYKIIFDKNNFIKKYLVFIKSKQEKNITMYNNIFFNKQQYIKYLDNYLYKIYDLEINNDINGILELENNYETNIYKILLNRKYLYNFLLFSPDKFYSELELINSFEKKILEINN